MEDLQVANSKLKAAHDEFEHDFEALCGKLGQEEKKLMDRVKGLELEKQNIAESFGDVTASTGDVVEVNAGGKIVVVKRAILTQFRGTRFESLFSGRWDKKLQKDINGRIFLDVNPICFQAIVSFLGKLETSPNENSSGPLMVNDEYHDLLMQQLNLFGISSLIPTVEVPDSTIVRDRDQSKVLHDWLQENGSDGTFELLYRSSRDGLSNSNFHSQCDNNGPTLTMIKTDNGEIFGGFTNEAWSSIGGHKVAENSFLFLLQQNGILSPMKFRLLNTTYSIYDSSSYGPIFGGGHDHDLYVNGTSVTLKIGNAYEIDTSLQSINATFVINEMEVFRVQPTAETRNEEQETSRNAYTEKSFTPELNKALDAKVKALKKAETEISLLERNFEDEEQFISSFATGDTKDVIVLNVSGTTMATDKSTLQIIEESVLARQFDDSMLAVQGIDYHRVKDWTPEEVSAWAKKIEGIPESVADAMEANEITGRELLTLGKEGLEMIGVTRVGTIFLLLDEIKKIKESIQEVVQFIEHSPYCFEKILDFLRWKRLHSLGLAEDPALPQVQDSEEEPFKKLVSFYFPGDSSKLILG